jgi:hypothetical protein
LVLSRTGNGWCSHLCRCSLRRLAVSLLVVASVTTGCRRKPGPPPGRRPSSVEAPEPPGELRIVDLKTGEGEPVVDGKRVVVQYEGRLSTGPKIDSTRDRDKPASFVVGRGNVLPGLDKGVVGMKVGGKRRLVIPPGLAYGKRGVAGVVPSGAELTYEVELLEVRDDDEKAKAGAPDAGGGRRR